MPEFFGGGAVRTGSFIRSSRNSQCMAQRAQAEIPLMILLFLALFVIGFIIVYPETCRSIPLQLPGSDFNFCLLFGQ